MADKKVSELSSLTHVSGDDLLLVVNDPNGSPSSRKVTVSNFFANVVSETTHKATTVFAANTEFTGSVANYTANVIFQGNVRLDGSTPASNNASDEGYGVGSIWYDENYMYIAVSSGTIKRVALNTFS
jgi:hypothetical protein